VLRDVLASRLAERDLDGQLHLVRQELVQAAGPQSGRCTGSPASSRGRCRRSPPAGAGRRMSDAADSSASCSRRYLLGRPSTRSGAQEHVLRCGHGRCLRRRVACVVAWSGVSAFAADAAAAARFRLRPSVSRTPSRSSARGRSSRTAPLPPAPDSCQELADEDVPGEAFDRDDVALRAVTPRFAENSRRAKSSLNRSQARKPRGCPRHCATKRVRASSSAAHWSGCPGTRSSAW
jgi:hypothetical protein